MTNDALVGLGAPGGGKGTLANRLARFYGVYSFSSGQAFREQSAQGSSWLKQYEQTLVDGSRFPDEVAIKLFEKYLVDDQVRSSRLVFLDGIPRTAEQARMLDRFVDVKGVVVLDAPDYVLLQRMYVRDSRGTDRDIISSIDRIIDYDEHKQPIIDVYRRRGVPILEVDTSMYSPKGVFELVSEEYFSLFTGLTRC